MHPLLLIDKDVQVHLPFSAMSTFKPRFPLTIPLFLSNQMYTQQPHSLSDPVVANGRLITLSFISVLI